MHAVGRGGHCIAGTAGYCFGNLSVPGYSLPWEPDDAKYPSNFAAPLQVAVEASNGASDYGNKFGEPVICGFARSFGCQLSNGERREWIKPIMFSGGIGSMNVLHTKKFKPEVGMLVGGPDNRHILIQSSTVLFFLIYFFMLHKVLLCCMGGLPVCS